MYSTTQEIAAARQAMPAPQEMPVQRPAPVLYAIGTAVPPHRISQADYEQLLLQAAGDDRAQRLRLRRIYAGSGIEYRHSVLAEFAEPDSGSHQVFHPHAGTPHTGTQARMDLYRQHALPLTIQAVADCLAQLQDFRKESVTHVITFSCTGLYAPGLDIELVNEFGLAIDAERTCINFMGCYAAINAMKTAAHICRSEPDAVVLIAGVELCTLHYLRLPETDQLVANAIFADGAAAAIISAQNISRKDGGVALALNHFYAAFEKEGVHDMVWRVGDFGFELRLSADVPGRIEGGIRALVQKLLDKSGARLEDIHRYAIHPGGARILQACEAALGVPSTAMACSYDVLRHYGNMSSVTVLFVLQKHLQSLKEKGKTVLACAFGPGLTMESLLSESC